MCQMRSKRSLMGVGIHIFYSVTFASVRPLMLIDQHPYLHTVLLINDSSHNFHACIHFAREIVKLEHNVPHAVDRSFSHAHSRVLHAISNSHIILLRLQKGQGRAFMRAYDGPLDDLDSRASEKGGTNVWKLHCMLTWDEHSSLWYICGKETLNAIPKCIRGTSHTKYQKQL